LEFPNVSVGGVSFSPNSRFLYFPNQTYDCVNDYPSASTEKCNIIQYDLSSESFPDFGDTVGVYDNLPFHNQLSPPVLAQLSSNGVIFFSSASIFMHQIKYPNRKGLNCKYINRGFKLPIMTNPYQIPYFPNYRLGPIDGSPCDSLGLDNHPLAQWRWEQEDSSQLSVTFTDNSFYEPATWHWDFAGLGVSQDTSPVFTFPQAGVYEVCMTVCNAYSCDKLCRQVNVVSVSGTKSADNQGFKRVEVSPNPATDILQVSLLNIPLNETTLEIMDVTGRIIKSSMIKSDYSQVSIQDLKQGLYFVSVIENGHVIFASKLVKL
jgi:hypothetical protein